ncbi:hypothetical protein [Enterococcus sp.]|jgi:hypothetical protein|uniref:hypothetical protein n=1 Tax=Enterococcus sp. TaxID=35783 RepID=UPI0025BF5003|nr:hypothetical protein [Enterococcus sp.]
MSDEQWLQLRRRRKIELYLCLIVVAPMVYGLWCNQVFLIRYMTLLFCVAVITAIYECFRLLYDHLKDKEKNKKG